MKKILLFLFFSLICSFNAQVLNGIDLNKVSPETRKELIRNLKPEEKKELFRKFRDEILMSDLNIEEHQKDQFRSVYNQYQQEQRKIKEEFNGKIDPDLLTDEQAEEMLEKSFDTGQKLLDNRRKYAREMQRVMKPQQVLKLFQNEGAIREKTLNQQNNMRNSGSPRNGMRSPQGNIRSGAGNDAARGPVRR